MARGVTWERGGVAHTRCVRGPPRSDTCPQLLSAADAQTLWIPANARLAAPPTLKNPCCQADSVRYRADARLIAASQRDRAMRALARFFTRSETTCTRESARSGRCGMRWGYWRSWRCVRRRHTARAGCDRHAGHGCHTGRSPHTGHAARPLEAQSRAAGRSARSTRCTGRPPICRRSPKRHRR